VLRLRCALGTLEGGGRITLEIPAVLSGDLEALEAAIEDGTPALVTGEADNILTNLEFTWENFREVFDAREFWTVIWATLFYTIFGTCGALLVGLFAAILLNKSFRGQGVLRGLYLFPYVAPVIAVAFSWVILFDPFSGSVNALADPDGRDGQFDQFLRRTAARPDHGDGVRDLALLPLSFLFILARMQSIDT
jgi:multiple sugar transport system permease protein